MIRGGTKRLLGAAGVILAFAVTSVTAWAAAGKNLKHFPKDITQDALKAEMSLIKRSVGMDCLQCHQRAPVRDFAVDTEKKKTARSMLDMTKKISEHAFTREFFGGKNPPKATCYMCHKGHEKVEVEAENPDAEKRFNDSVASGKKKRVVEGMKKLVAALNKDYFTWKDAPKATCWMCHRGKFEFSVNAPKGGDRGGGGDDEGEKKAEPDAGKKPGAERGGKTDQPY